jgi:adenine-specific DNA-methyltransferase
MVEKINLESGNILEENISKLRQIFPNVFSEGKIDFDKLKETLGNFTNSSSEKYSFSWAGRIDSIKNIQTPTHGTLIRQKDESINFEDTENIFIEGENLEVLKLLQKSYSNKIKMIYIDPPYNTGNDFIYKDDFKNSSLNYLEQTGQLKEGVKLTSNPETNGRFHSDWMSFMYPRLFLAKSLLKENGIIFVSIDDNEIHNIKNILNEIFGEENFIIEFAWRKSDNQANIGNIANVKEYVLCYAKNKSITSFNKMELTDRALKEYRYGKNDKKFRRDILLHKTRGRHRYTVVTPSGKKLDGPWMIPEDSFRILEKTDEIYWASGRQEQPYGKIYLKDVKGMLPNDFLGIEFGTNQEGSQEITDLFGKRVFDFPKPTSLIKHFVTIASDENDIILDFFAGSGTTAHSILSLNSNTLSTRKFICVQIPEKIKEKIEVHTKEYKTIADISKERIRKVIKKINDEHKQQKLTDVKHDLGFKVFKLAKSNYKVWQDVKDEAKLKEQLKLFEDPLVENYKDIDVIYEIIIKEGYALNSEITEISVKPNKIYKVSDDEFVFFVTLDENIDEKSLENLNLTKNIMFVCLDSAINDSQKTNLDKLCKLKTI